MIDQRLEFVIVDRSGPLGYEPGGRVENNPDRGFCFVIELHGIRSSVSLRVSNLKLQSVQPQCVGDHGDRAEGHGDAGDHRT